MTRNFPAIVLAITLALASGPAEAGITAVFGGLKGPATSSPTSAPTAPAIRADEASGPIALLVVAPPFDLDGLDIRTLAATAPALPFH